MKKLNITEYIESFKAMLVHTYNWSIIKAAEYENQRLIQAYEKGFSIEEAYCDIFDIQNDRMHIEYEGEYTIENGRCKTS